MARLAIAGAPAPEVEDVAGHPVWCAEGHRCTAYTMPSGGHVSIPEIWETDVGRFVTTRHRLNDGTNWMELRVVLVLDPRERVAQGMCRHLMALAYKVVARAFGHDQPAARVGTT